jgi:hypothetical protein
VSPAETFSKSAFGLQNTFVCIVAIVGSSVMQHHEEIIWAKEQDGQQTGVKAPLGQLLLL